MDPARGRRADHRFDGIITDLVINAPSVHFISLYLALSRKAQNLCSIFANGNGSFLVSSF